LVAYKIKVYALLQQQKQSAGQRQRNDVVVHFVSVVAVVFVTGSRR